MKKLSLSAATIALLAAAPAAVLAQETAASLRGTVTDANGAPVSGATVTIMHTASGTASTAATSASGSFYEAGLRVGGPYTIYVSAPGFEGDVLEGLFLRPGTQAPLQIALSSASVEVITVTGVAVNTIDLNNGVGSSYSAADIGNQPSTSRDVLRTLSRDPLAIVSGGGSLSVAGSNPRFNALAIDGSLQQDDFGLSSSTYATSRSPINLDAIESASVAASDYSVTVGNFTGGLVNVVTRSGTNEIDGSAFYYRQDQDYIGNVTNGTYVDQPAFLEEEYGFTVGGPIIEDRLFFFVSYDKFESGSSSNFTVADSQNGVDPAFFTALANLVQTSTGYDMGDRPTTVANPVYSERYLGKLDWNINADHRLSFTFQQTEEGGTSNVGSNNFNTAWYDTPTDLTAYTVQLFSDWTPNLSTTLRANFKDYTRGQDCRAGTDIPQLEFSLSEDDVAGTALDGLVAYPGSSSRDVTFIGGCDQYRHANEYDDSRLQLFGSADYVWGDHVFTVGGEYEQFELRNLFIAASSGRFRYYSVNAIETNSPNVSYSNIPSNNTAEGATSFTSDRIVLFGQDNWQIRDDFSINYGFRYERFGMDDQPIADTNIESDYGISSTGNLDGIDIFMPRIGFRWDALDRTTVSGGFGRFAGGNPWVWISNAFQQPVVSTSGNFTNLPNLDVPASLLANVAGGTAGRVDIIDPNFELPSDWKASLRIDHEFDMNFGLINLGSDYRATFQYLYTNSDQTFGWRNLTQTELAGSLPVGVAPDGRPIYADLEALGYATGLTELTNFDGGDSHVFSVTLGKDYDNGFGFQIGYAYQDVTAVTEGTSSRGISNWRGIADVDPNNPSPRTSIFQVEDRFTVNLSYATEIFGDLETRFDLFGDITSGSAFHYSFYEDRNGALFGRSGYFEDPYANSPLYVPNMTDDLVVYASGFDQVGFNELVDSQGLARGRIQEAFGQQSGWNQQWDLRIQQDLPGLWGADRFVGDNRFKIVLDVQNVLNLLNDEWGTQTYGPSNGQLSAVTADMVSAADVTAFGVDGATALAPADIRTTCTTADACLYRFENFSVRDETTANLGGSVYRIRVGIRYEF